jgi:hypothetical protein
MKNYIKKLLFRIERDLHRQHFQSKVDKLGKAWGKARLPNTLFFVCMSLKNQLFFLISSRLLAGPLTTFPVWPENLEP